MEFLLFKCVYNKVLVLYSLVIFCGLGVSALNFTQHKIKCRSINRNSQVKNMLLYLCLLKNSIHTHRCDSEIVLDTILFVRDQKRQRNVSKKNLHLSHHISLVNLKFLLLIHCFPSLKWAVAQQTANYTTLTPKSTESFELSSMVGFCCVLDSAALKRTPAKLLFYSQISVFCLQKNSKAKCALSFRGRVLRFNKEEQISTKISASCCCLCGNIVT